MSVEDTNVPPVPSQSPMNESDPEHKRFGVTWTQWFEVLRKKINVLNQSIVALAGISTSGFLVHTVLGWVTRTITGKSGEITVSEGGGSSGDPEIGLADTSVIPGSYTATALTVDSKGRITAASSGSASGSPLTTKGDLFGFSTADARVPIGIDGEVLTADSTSPTGLAYKPPGTPTLPVTTKGDTLGYSTLPARVPVGTDGQVYTADSTNSLGVSWKFITSLVGITKLSASATSITVTGLDLNQDITYRIVGSVANTGSTGANISLYFNSDTTDANYRRIVVTAPVGSGSVATSGSSNDAVVAGVNGSVVTNFTGDVSIDATGSPRTLLYSARDNGSSLQWQGTAHRWLGSANVTSLTFTASVANVFAAGSFVAIYR